MLEVYLLWARFYCHTSCSWYFHVCIIKKIAVWWTITACSVYILQSKSLSINNNSDNGETGLLFWSQTSKSFTQQLIGW